MNNLEYPKYDKYVSIPLLITMSLPLAILGLSLSTTSTPLPTKRLISVPKLG